jgi:electron transport complex protein RnfB
VRATRLERRERDPRWNRSPWRIESSSCVNCDRCLVACPPAYGAVLQRRFAPVIVPELCSGCGRCATACPVDCIVEDPAWVAAPERWWEEISA